MLQSEINTIIIIICLVLIVGILAFTLFCTFGNCAPKGVFVERQEKHAKVKSEDKPVKSAKFVMKKKWTSHELYEYGFYISLYIFMLFTTGVGAGYPNFLVTFVYYYLELSKETGALLQTAFNMAGTASCLLHMFLTMFIGTDKLLIIGAFLSLLSGIALMLFINTHWIVIWICTVLLSASLYPGFCLMQAWGNRVVGADGKFQSFFFFGIHSGVLIFPSVMGLLLETVGPVSFLYSVVACCVGYFAGALFLKLFERRLIASAAITNANTNITDECEETLV